MATKNKGFDHVVKRPKDNLKAIYENPKWDRTKIVAFEFIPYFKNLCDEKRVCYKSL